MRFVKNLLVAAGLATTVLDGVVGAPAGNIRPLYPSKPFPPASTTTGNATTTSYTRGGGLPHFPSGKATIVVPGTSISLPVRPDNTPAFGAPGNSLPVGPDPVHPTGISGQEPPFPVSRVVDRGDEGATVFTVTTTSTTTVSTSWSNRAGEPPASVTAGADAHATEGLSDETETPEPSTPAASAIDARDTAALAASTSCVGRCAVNSEKTVEAPAVTQQAGYNFHERQMLPISGNVAAAVSSACVGGCAVNTEKTVEAAAVTERQMLPITSSTISARDAAASSSCVGGCPANSEKTARAQAITERQMLPISGNIAAVVSSACVGGCAVNTEKTVEAAAVTERQMLPITSATLSARNTAAAASSPCAGGCAVNSDKGSESPAGTQQADYVEFAQATQGAISTVTATDMHTVTLAPSSSSTPITTTTVVSTELVTITVPKLSSTSSDNCTTPTSMVSGSYSWAATTTWSAPTSITSHDGTGPARSITETSRDFPPHNGTLTFTRTCISATDKSEETVNTIASTLTSSTYSVTTATETATGQTCNQVSCSLSTWIVTETETLTSSTSPAPADATTATTGATPTSDADTCTSTQSSTTSSAEETTLTTVHTHTTTTVSSPTSSPSPTSPADETTLTTVHTHITTTLSGTLGVGPPHLTPPPITRRDDGPPPEAGPLDPPPRFSATSGVVIPFPVDPPVDTPIGQTAPEPGSCPPWISTRPPCPTRTETEGTSKSLPRMIHTPPHGSRSMLVTSVIPTAA
ncbi:hypothetical protein UCDDA912_g02137 [Diaporthe ampelina]|uniref:Uncharacterized protein n=1 Tax=Diaporthe ampelina TaxID=1214573 RepID=A0A0G2IE52_9PEZI|nr:hypothetical protein UCDDA912_g02137 [Diaporthe ampelina]